MTKEPHKVKFLSVCRIRDGLGGGWNSSDADGMNGTFLIPFTDEKGNEYRLGCIASDKLGWEHVSVTNQTARGSSKVPPSWDMMCRAKRAFWDDDECVIEYHVPQTDWVNEHPGCLHLWKPIGVDVPRPPSLFVGIREADVDCGPNY